MPFLESISFPIRAEPARTSDEEEALFSSSRGGDDDISSSTTTRTNRNDETLLESPVEQQQDEGAVNRKMSEIEDELKEIQRQNDELKRKMQNLSDDLEFKMQHQNEELERRLEEKLTQLLHNSGMNNRENTTDAEQSRINRRNLLRSRSSLTIDADGKQIFSLPQDTFSLMMVSKPISGPWCIGLLVYAPRT